MLGALVTAVAAAGVVVWSGSRGGGAPNAPGEAVAAERGDVAVTVGGIGRVSTRAGGSALAVPAAGSSSSGSASAPAGGSAAAGGATASSSRAGSSGASGGSPGASGGAGPLVSADAVFPTATGRVSKLLVKSGDRVSAGQPIAVIADDGAAAGGVIGARSDLATARLELAQKQVQDPARGVAPTAGEFASGSALVRAAQAKLDRVLAPPLAVDVAIARSDFGKALADLATARSSVISPQAFAAAQLGVETARQKLATLIGGQDATAVAAAQLELAKATLDQETLLRPPDAPSALALAAADAAVAAAQQRVAETQASASSDAAIARSDLAKAQSDREALTRRAVPPTAAAQAAAQLAIDAARQKLDTVANPPTAAVTAARREVAMAVADLAGLDAKRGTTGVAAARSGVTTARRKLAALRHPTNAVVSVARADVRKAQADLAVLRQRGAPASAINLALARLKVSVGSQRLALAGEMVRRLTVRANASGIVTSILTARGAAADRTTPLARIEDLDHLVVTLDLSEFDVARIRVGGPVRVGVDALGGREFGGHVLDIASGGVATGGVVNFPVIIALNSQRRLRPGMSVSARVIVSQRKDVVRIPLTAVAHKQSRPTVIVRASSGADRQRPVKLGLSGAEFVEVRSGLRAGERVVVPGAKGEA